jgi:ubiquinol-cytochrome c reductase cytochrome b subunit/menaquinol-cytochrome c reductase cytochrome b/c subunit
MEREEVLAGDTIAGQAGCLACHVIGHQGNSGPGPDLTRVGARLTKAQLLHALRSPQPPMPSFQSLGRARLVDLVEFLHALR